MSYITTNRSKTKTTVTERFYDEEGRLTKEVETITEVEPQDTYQPFPPPYQNPIWYSSASGTLINDNDFGTTI